MVKRKIKFYIVPHQPGEKPKHFRFPVLILLIVLLIVVVVVSIFLKNLNYYVDVSSIPDMEEDNKILKEKLQEFKSEAESLNKQLQSLKRKQENVLKKYKFSIEKPEEKDSVESIDTLLAKASFTEQILKSAINIVKEKGNIVPSILPVGGVIVRKYGKSWDMYTERWKWSNGIEIGAPEGTDVVATANGVVSKTGKNIGLGNFIEIKHGNKYKTIYGHLKSFNVKEGQKVVRGEKIGEVGRTGKTPFPLLYYEVDVDGKPANPENFIHGRIE